MTLKAIKVLLCSVITEEYVEYRLVVVAIKIFWFLKCLRTLAELTRDVAGNDWKTMQCVVNAKD